MEENGTSGLSPPPKLNSYCNANPSDAALHQQAELSCAQVFSSKDNEMTSETGNIKTNCCLWCEKNGRSEVCNPTIIQLYYGTPAINVQPNPAQQQPNPPRAYRGHPSKQRNPQAPNSWKESNPTRNTPASQPNRPQRPLALNKPTQVHNNVNPLLTSGNPADGSVFTAEVTVRETVSRMTFSPSTPALIEVARQTLCEMVTDDPQLSKTLLPEYFDYYATALLWLRITNIKQKNSQKITETESDMLVLTRTTAFCAPEPLVLQYKQIGNIVTMTKQHLYPEFPPLPEVPINNGGYWHTN
ncbi:hypothetical protein JTB14_019763 [Gonioctena quinquepunctata]|nr:hypothetical protein JTB14_019763 [Gonioctena quinquepunctata]